MSNGAHIAASIAGTADGDAFLSKINYCSPADALAVEILRILASDSPGNPKLFAFARTIQKKALERRAP